MFDRAEVLLQSYRAEIAAMRASQIWLFEVENTWLLTQEATWLIISTLSLNEVLNARGLGSTVSGYVSRDSFMLSSRGRRSILCVYCIVRVVEQRWLYFLWTQKRCPLSRTTPQRRSLNTKSGCFEDLNSSLSSGLGGLWNSLTTAYWSENNPPCAKQ